TSCNSPIGCSPSSNATYAGMLLDSAKRLPGRNPEGVCVQKAAPSRFVRQMSASPILFGMIVIEGFGADRFFTVGLCQVFHPIGGSVLQHVFVRRNTVAALVCI